MFFFLKKLTVTKQATKFPTDMELDVHHHVPKATR
jgi:hypothetical protein